MKIEFEDNSYIEFSKVDKKIFISVAAKDASNYRKLIVNTVELSPDQVVALFKSIN